MKIDKNILIMSLFPERVISHFDETFNTFKLYEQEDKEKYLKDISERILNTLDSVEMVNELSIIIKGKYLIVLLFLLAVKFGLSFIIVFAVVSIDV